MSRGELTWVVVVVCGLCIHVGYSTVSSRADMAYRAEMFPGLGFMMKRTVYEQTMKAKMSECCSNRSARLSVQQISFEFINEHLFILR